MPTYLIYTEVHYDGIGDYSHFEDISRHLLNDPAYSDVSFILIIKPGSQIDKIKPKLTSFNIPMYIQAAGKDMDEDMCEKPHIADQIIVISYGHFPDVYRHLLPEHKIPEKEIREHAMRYPSITSTHMGLSDCNLGIKIGPLISKPLPAEAWRVIEKHDPVFSQRLLDCTDSNNFDSFY